MNINSNDDGLNQVYQKQAGTGSAFLLGDSQAANIANQYMALDEQRNYQNKLYQQQLFQEKQNQINKELKALSPPEYWQMISQQADIPKKYSELLQKGAELKVKGIDPFYDPEFSKMKNDLYSRANASKELQKLYEKDATEISKHPDMFENAADITSYYGDGVLDNYLNGKFNAPQFRKNTSIVSALKDVGYKGIQDESTDAAGNTNIKSLNVPETTKGVYSVYLNNPQASRILAKAGGYEQPELLGGFPLTDADGNITFPKTDEEVDKYIQNNPNLLSDPKFGEAMLKLGFKEGDNPTEFAKKVISTQNKAVGSIVEQGVDYATGGMKTGEIFTGKGKQLSLQQQKLNETKKQNAFNRGIANERLKLAQQEAKRKDGNDGTSGLSIGNADYNVTIGTINKNGVPEKKGTAMGASLASYNIGNINTVVSPGTYYDHNTGVAVKNSKSISVKAGQMRLVPVLNDKNSPYNGGEVSLSALKNIMNGSSKVKPDNVRFEIVAYGTKEIVDKFGNKKQEPISFNASNLNGNKDKSVFAGIKALEQKKNELIGLFSDSEFASMTPQQQFEFLKEEYQLED